MNTLSGWKDSWAATRVCLTAAAVLLQKAGFYTADMGLIWLQGICWYNLILELWNKIVLFDV